MTDQRIALIRALNDRLRMQHVGGRLLLTPGVTALGADTVIAVLLAIQAFNSFSKESDPYDEHDFGSLDFRGSKIFWKIDYYDRSLRSGAEDPSNEESCTRVLTVMLAEEY